jgi:hypothetical protein
MRVCLRGRLFGLYESRRSSGRSIQHEFRNASEHFVPRAQQQLVALHTLYEQVYVLLPRVSDGSVRVDGLRADE